MDRATVKAILRNPHFWVILTLMVILSGHHYTEQISLWGNFGLAAYPVLYLIPVVYCGFIFGATAALVTAFTALLIMLPQAVFFSPNLPGALFEAGIVTLIGIAASLMLKVRERKMAAGQDRQIVAETLTVTRNKLRSQTRKVMSYERKLAMVGSVCNKFIHSLNIEQVLHDALRKVSEVMDVEVILIFQLCEEARELNLIAYEGVSEEFARSMDKLKLGEGLNGLVAQSGEALLVKDASIDPRLTREVVRQEDIKSMLIVPMKCEEEVKGTLCIASRGYREFAEEEMELLTAVASQIYICSENTRLYQEQARMMEQVRASERSYRELFESAHDAIWIHDLRGNIIAANEPAARLIGFDTEEIPSGLLGYDSEKVPYKLDEYGLSPLPLNVKSFLSEESLSLAGEMRDKLLQGHKAVQPYEQQITRADGTMATVMLTTNLIARNGEPKAFQNIARDISKEKQMQENMRLYIQQITRAQEEESSRIARELHDSTAQELIALLHQVEGLLRDRAKLPLSEAKALWGVHEQIKGILQEVRYFSRDLRPSILDDLGLRAALEWLVEQLETEHKVECHLIVVGQERRLASETEVMIFRIVQEAIRNIRKHSQASKAEVTVKFGRKETTITVKDNGVGFQLLESVGDLTRAGKLGLAGMQERAQLLGGSLSIQSEPGKGTTILVKTPV
jgi:two-component system sensor histidine kinase DegS